MTTKPVSARERVTRLNNLADVFNLGRHLATRRSYTLRRTPVCNHGNVRTKDFAIVVLRIQTQLTDVFRLTMQIEQKF